MDSRRIASIELERVEASIHSLTIAQSARRGAPSGPARIFERDVLFESCDETERNCSEIHSRHVPEKLFPFPDALLHIKSAANQVVSRALCFIVKGICLLLSGHPREWLPFGKEARRCLYDLVWFA